MTNETKAPAQLDKDIDRMNDDMTPKPMKPPVADGSTVGRVAQNVGRDLNPRITKESGPVVAKVAARDTEKRSDDYMAKDSEARDAAEPFDEAKIKKNWSAIKKEVQSTWSRVSTSELDQCQGEYKRLGELIAQKYGPEQFKGQVQKKLTEILSHCKVDVAQAPRTDRSEKKETSQTTRNV